MYRLKLSAIQVLSKDFNVKFVVVSQTGADKCVFHDAGCGCIWYRPGSHIYSFCDASCGCRWYRGGTHI